MIQQVSLSDVVDLIDPDWDKRLYLVKDEEGWTYVVKGHRLAREFALDPSKVQGVDDPVMGATSLIDIGIDLEEIQGPAIVHLKIPVLLAIEYLSP